MKRAYVLASGGLDSAVTAFVAKHSLGYDELRFLFFDYGQRALVEERHCAKMLAKALDAEFQEISLPWLHEISTSFINMQGDTPKTTEKDLETGKKEILDWWVPCRNAVFLITALAHAEHEFLQKQERFDIFIGLKNEGSVHMKDTTPKFVQRMNELAEEATHHGGYKIIAPLLKEDKTDVIKIGKELSVPFQQTYSCYVGSGFENRIPVHCGTCLNCMLRKKGFYWSGVDDPSVYRV